MRARVSEKRFFNTVMENSTSAIEAGEKPSVDDFCLSHFLRYANIFTHSLNCCSFGGKIMTENRVVADFDTENRGVPLVCVPV